MGVTNHFLNLDDPPSNLLRIFAKSGDVRSSRQNCWVRTCQPNFVGRFCATKTCKKTQNRGSSGTKKLGKFPWFEKPWVSWLRMEAEILESQKKWVFLSRWMNQPHQPIASWWLNQPIWKKYVLVKLDHFPGGVKIKHVWKHQIGFLNADDCFGQIFLTSFSGFPFQICSVILSAANRRKHWSYSVGYWETSDPCILRLWAHQSPLLWPFENPRIENPKIPYEKDTSPSLQG